MTDPVVPAAPAADPVPRGGGGASPLVAALLSAIVPGAGQAYERRFPAALLFFVPVALLSVVAGALAGASSLPSLAGSLLAPGALTSIVVLDLALLAWRIAAVIDAWRAARRGADPAAPSVDGTGEAPHRARTALGIVALVAILLFVSVPHAVAGWYATAASTAAAEIFAEPDADPLAGLDAAPGPTLAGDADAIAAAPATLAPTAAPAASVAPAVVATPSPAPTATPVPTPTPVPVPTPVPTPTPLMSRVNVLLLGIDSGPGRNQALTDTMIVVSLDPVGKTVSMMSIPRDTVNAPLPDGAGYYQPKLNSLLAYADRNPGAFPGRRPIRVLKDTIAGIVGMPVDYYASVDLPGFIEVIDAIGGVGVYVKEPLADYRYREYGFNGYYIDAGCHHLDGQWALAFARIRYSAGQNDFTRAGRQQQVLVAARDQVVRKGLLLDVPALFTALGKTIRTDIPRSLVPTLAELATEIDARDVTQAVVQPPLVAYGNNGYGSVLIPDLAAIRTVADGLFSATGTQPVGWPPPAATPTPDPAKAKAPKPTPPVCK